MSGLSLYLSTIMSECEAEGRDATTAELKTAYMKADRIERDAYKMAQVIMWLKNWRDRVGFHSQIDPLYLASFDSIMRHMEEK